MDKILPKIKIEGTIIQTSLDDEQEQQLADALAAAGKSRITQTGEGSRPAGGLASPRDGPLAAARRDRRPRAHAGRRCSAFGAARRARGRLARHAAVDLRRRRARARARPGRRRARAARLEARDAPRSSCSRRCSSPSSRSCSSPPARCGTRSWSSSTIAAGVLGRAARAATCVPGPRSRRRAPTTRSANALKDLAAGPAGRRERAARHRRRRRSARSSRWSR